MSENILCCRICLDVESEHVSILENPQIHLHIKSCLAITVSASEDLPTTVCINCVTRLNDFYNFLLNAQCSQEWLEEAMQNKLRKTAETETKSVIQPLPDSEYNSDSLLEFLNNTDNIEEYLNNLGKEDIPSFVNMLDKNSENTVNNERKTLNSFNTIALPSPRKQETFFRSKEQNNMDIDVLDSDIEIVKEILIKESDPKMARLNKLEKSIICVACKSNFETSQRLTQHLSVCEQANKMCMECSTLFDSQFNMLQHRVYLHVTIPWTCKCGIKFQAHEKLLLHYKTCQLDYLPLKACIYRCKVCGERFQERYKLYNHVKRHLSKIDEKICDICGHNFIGENALNIHRSKEHNIPVDMMYRCKVCQFTSKDRQLLFLHVKKHSGLKEPSSRLCECCGRKFATQTSLLRHSAQHGVLPFKCHTCDKRFPNTDARHIHEKVHYDQIMCEKCGQYVSSLSEHICK